MSSTGRILPKRVRVVNGEVDKSSGAKPRLPTAMSPQPGPSQSPPQPGPAQPAPQPGPAHRAPRGTPSQTPARPPRTHPAVRRIRLDQDGIT